MIHCRRYVNSCGHISIQAECFSRTGGHISIQVQGNIHTHVIWKRVYMSMSVYAGVLNNGTVYDTSSLFGIWYTHVLWNHTLNKFMVMLDHRMMIGVFLFWSVLDKWQSGKVIVVISPWRSLWLVVRPLAQARDFNLHIAEKRFGV